MTKKSQVKKGKRKKLVITDEVLLDLLMKSTKDIETAINLTRQSEYSIEVELLNYADKKYNYFVSDLKESSVIWGGAKFINKIQSFLDSRYIVLDYYIGVYSDDYMSLTLRLSLAESPFGKIHIA